MTADNHSAAWHAERLTGIGASDMTDLFSLPSPYKTIPAAGGCVRKLWYEKSGVVPDFPRVTKPSMQRGTDCEAIVARKLAEATGWRIRHKRQMLRHPDVPFLIAHVDRQITNAEGKHGGLKGRGALECKTVNQHVARKIAKDGLNDGYLLQMQAIELAGVYAWGAFGVMDVDAWETIPPIIITPDIAVQKQIVDRGAALWAMVLDASSPGPERLPAGAAPCTECQWRTKCLQIL